MNKRRLLKLADLLEADASNKKGVKFDLGHWAAKGEDTHAFDLATPIPVSCETTACAVGLACISGAFKTAGLGYDISFSGILTPSYKGLGNWDAIESLFDINNQHAEFLFSMHSYPKAKRSGATAERFVAQRIRDFVDGTARPKAAPPRASR